MSAYIAAAVNTMLRITVPMAPVVQPAGARPPHIASISPLIALARIVHRRQADVAQAVEMV